MWTSTLSIPVKNVQIAHTGVHIVVSHPALYCISVINHDVCDNNFDSLLVHTISMWKYSMAANTTVQQPDFQQYLQVKVVMKLDYVTTGSHWTLNIENSNMTYAKVKSGFI